MERKRAVEEFSCKSCSLEYVLEGNKNSVNCMESFADQLWSGGSDCSVRCWALPSSTAGPYTSYLSQGHRAAAKAKSRHPPQASARNSQVLGPDGLCKQRWGGKAVDSTEKTHKEH